MLDDEQIPLPISDELKRRIAIEDKIMRSIVWQRKHLFSHFDLASFIHFISVILHIKKREQRDEHHPS